MLSLLILIIFVLWLAGALGGAPASPPPFNLVVFILVFVVLLSLGEGYSGYHSGYFWHGR